jgi:hypothetical protein
MNFNEDSLVAQNGHRLPELIKRFSNFASCESTVRGAAGKCSMITWTMSVAPRTNGTRGIA